MTIRQQFDGHAEVARAAASAETSATDEPLSAALTEALALACAPIAPDAQASARIKGRLLEQIRATGADRMQVDDSLPGTLTVRADAGEWTTIAPKVHVKPLHRDAESRSFLLRIDAGGTLTQHHHDGIEECVVLQGECFLGSLRLSAGDYHLALSGSTHGDAHSLSGALLFLRTRAQRVYEART